MLQERQEAKKLFATENGAPAKAPPPPPAKTFVPGEIPSEDSLEATPVEVEEPSRKGPTPEQIIAIKVLQFQLNICFLVAWIMFTAKIQRSCAFTSLHYVLSWMNNSSWSTSSIICQVLPCLLFSILKRTLSEKNFLCTCDSDRYCKFSDAWRGRQAWKGTTARYILGNWVSFYFLLDFSSIIKFTTFSYAVVNFYLAHCACIEILFFFCRL